MLVTWDAGAFCSAWLRIVLCTVAAGSLLSSESHARAGKRAPAAVHRPDSEAPRVESAPVQDSLRRQGWRARHVVGVDSVHVSGMQCSCVAGATGRLASLADSKLQGCNPLLLVASAKAIA
jgi:hypothetical protein